MTAKRTPRAPKVALPISLRTDADDPTVLLLLWSDGRSAPVQRALVDGLRIRPDRRLAAKDATRLARALATDAARDAALRLLARADRSAASLRERLAQAGHDGPAVESAIASLRADGWLDDLRYAGSLLERSLGAARDAAARRRAIARCRRAGLDADTISAALRHLGVASDVEDL